MKQMKQGVIASANDLVSLNIIDWNRLNGTSPNPARAMHDISSWLIGKTVYTLIEHDLRKAPVRDDFPDWDHVGSAHTGTAHLFWNDFKMRFPEAELILSDEPDFYGTLKDTHKEDLVEDRPFYETDAMGYAHFWGDIGTVSASAFALTVTRKMQKGDIWLSVSTTQQVIIEALEDLQMNFCSETLGLRTPSEPQTASQTRQTRQWKRK